MSKTTIDKEDLDYMSGLLEELCIKCRENPCGSNRGDKALLRDLHDIATVLHRMIETRRGDRDE